MCVCVRGKMNFPRQPHAEVCRPRNSGAEAHLQQYYTLLWIRKWMPFARTGVKWNETTTREHTTSSFVYWMRACRVSSLIVVWKFLSLAIVQFICVLGHSADAHTQSAHCFLSLCALGASLAFHSLLLAKWGNERERKWSISQSRAPSALRPTDWLSEIRSSVWRWDFVSCTL